jgi:hypothetical protein
VNGVLTTSLAWASSATREAMVAAGSLAPPPVAMPEPNWLLYYAGIWAVCAFPRRPLAWGVAVLCVGSAFLLGRV